MLAMGKSQFPQIKPQRCKRDPSGAFIWENKQKWHQAPSALRTNLTIKLTLSLPEARRGERHGNMTIARNIQGRNGQSKLSVSLSFLSMVLFLSTRVFL